MPFGERSEPPLPYAMPFGERSEPPLPSAWQRGICGDELSKLVILCACIKAWAIFVWVEVMVPVHLKKTKSHTQSL